jgi:hypothetical protein
MNTQQPKRHERQLTEEEKQKVEEATTYEQLRGVVYKFKGERKRWFEDRRGASK